jgi:hypothetical protein
MTNFQGNLTPGGWRQQEGPEDIQLSLFSPLIPDSRREAQPWLAPPGLP